MNHATTELANILAAAHRCPLAASSTVTLVSRTLAYALAECGDPTAAVGRAAAWLRWGGVPVGTPADARWAVATLDGAALGLGWLGVYPDAAPRVLYPDR